jgi:hypothetical protein
MPQTCDGRKYIIARDGQGQTSRVFTDHLVETEPWPEDEVGAVVTITVPRAALDTDDGDDEPEFATDQLPLKSERVMINGARAPPLVASQQPSRSLKAPPFKSRIKDALDVARGAGFGRVRVMTRDGTSFDFSVDDDENHTTDGVDDANEADAAMKRWKQQRNAAKKS